MKRLIFVFAFMATVMTACAQTDQTFNKPPYFNAGFYLNGVLYTTIPTGGVADWNTLLNKPVTFPPAIHNHDALYKPLLWKPDWSDVLNKPQEMSLSQGIEQLGYLPIPERTTAEINSLVLPVGKSGIVKDKTLGVYKLWDGITWGKIVITNQ